MSGKRQGQWLDRLSGLVLAAAAGVVLLTAGPALLRAGGVEAPPGAREGARAGRGEVEPDPSGEAAAPRHHGFVFQDEGDKHDPIDDLERLYPEEFSGGSAHDPGSRSLGKAERGAARLGIAKKALKLTEEPGGSGVAGQIKAGELVMIVKETGEWAQVAHSGEGALEIGWVQKSELAIR